MLKPDAVKRGLMGEIIRRIELKGMTISEMKMLTASRELAEKHYEMHSAKPHFNDLVEFTTSGPVVAMVVGGENCIEIMRRIMGPPDPKECVPGTIRGDFTISLRQNLIHGSDSEESAKRELALWFPELFS